MKFSNGQEALTSVKGAILSIILWIILLGYLLLKVDTFMRRKQVDIISAVQEDFYDESHIVLAKQGFNFAVTLLNNES